MCDIGINKGCKDCPYLYNEEFCLIEEDYIEEDEIREKRLNKYAIKINGIYKE